MILFFLMTTSSCKNSDEPLMEGNSANEIAEEHSKTSIYDFTMANIDGDPVVLSDYRGKVLMIVNVASKCGYTPQYEQLEQIYEKYSDRGFFVLGFPANNFANQEPGNNSDIKTFCTTNYNITFPMFSKISVKGEDKHPLYKYLTEEKTNPKFSGEITWNFNKFLIGKDGQVINRFATNIKPNAPEVIEAIEAALK